MISTEILIRITWCQVYMGNKTIKEPPTIGKTTTVVNQGKSFVIKIR